MTSAATLAAAGIAAADAALIPLYRAGHNPRDTKTALTTVITDAILRNPRSLQTRIGPSALGTECDPCLVLALAEQRGPDEADWLPFIGRAVHAELDLIAIAHEAHADTPRFLSETKLTVGEVAGVPITGSCDLFDIWTGTSVDYKIVGATTLRAARGNGPSPVYRVQGHLYGRGWARAGYRVDHVAIWYLPRNEPDLRNGVWWSEPYDEQVALDALARAEFWAVTTAALGLPATLAIAGPHLGHHSCRHSAGYVPNPRSGPTTVAELLR